MDSNQQDIEKEVVGNKDVTLSNGERELLESSDRGVVQADNESAAEKVDYRYAGFWMRFWAYLLDLVVIASLNGILVYPLFRALDIKISDPSMFAPASIVTAVIFYAYFVLMTKFFKQTLGKMVFGLKVISLDQTPLSWSTIMFREWIGRFISGSILILYVVVAFLPRRQGIHDLFADTTVVHVRS
ncbi:RDD family protein [Niallia oryzisoli]|uniref:RDD family protein n=1 Tax=Niallia oryzisoli TaxID=1737571 RepID=UPI003736A0F8